MYINDVLSVIAFIISTLHMLLHGAHYVMQSSCSVRMKSVEENNTSVSFQESDILNGKKKEMLQSGG